MKLAAWCLGSAFVPAALLGAMRASAQDSGAGEIIVTGERQDRTKSDTTSSVVVMTGEDIDAASADGIDQVLLLVPNIQLGSGGEGPTIRGLDSTGVLRDLPAFMGGTRPRATLRVDGRDVSYNEFAFGTAPLWDVARVEVFRSPQTTTQGRNSIAGAIFVETAKPTFEWEAKVRAFGTTETARQVSGVVSGPLIADQLAFRISADDRRGHSFSRISSPAVGIDPNRDDYGVLRAKLLATPSALPGFTFDATYARTSSQAPQFEGVHTPFAERRDPNITYGIFKTRADALTLRARQVFQPDLSLRATASFGDTKIRRFAPPGFGETSIEGDDRSLELVLDWAPSEAVHLLFGAHASENELDQRIDLTAARLGIGQFADRQTSFGVFGEADWEPLPRIELIVGGRYQGDRQVRSGTLGVGSRLVPIAYVGRFEAFLPKASVSYEVFEGARVGLLVQRAYNPGGTTISLATFTPDTFAAETLWAYEVFARYASPRGKLLLSGNVFRYTMHDAQRSLVRELISSGGTVYFAETANAPHAWSQGAELEATWRPSHSFSLSAAIGLLDTRLTEALSDADPLVGKRFQRAPSFTGNLAMKWRPAAPLLLTAQFRRGSSYFSDDTNDPTRKISPSTTADARVEWQSGGLTVFAFARNVFDNFYLTYLFTPGTGRATAGDPRELGIGLELGF